MEGDANLATPHIEQKVVRAALAGSTELDLLGIPCAEITAQMNSARIDSDEATKYFVSSLMECCVERL